MLFSNLILAAGENAAKGAASQATQSSGSLGGLGMILWLVVIFGVMYFLLIRPQRKREKEEQKMRNDLRVGDEIVTIGGIICRVVNVKEDLIIVETGADRTKLSMKKWAVQQNTTVHDDPVVDDDDDLDDIDDDDI